MKILESTNKKLILKDCPQINLTIYITICFFNFLLVFYFKIIDIPIWFFALVNLLAIGYFVSKTKYMTCSINKEEDIIFLEIRNIFNKTRLQRIKIHDVKNVNFTRRRVKRSNIYEIILVLQSNKIVSLTPNPIFSRENAENASLSISRFLNLDFPQELEIRSNSSKKEIVIFYSFIIAIPVIYLSFYPGKTLVDAAKRRDIISVRNYLNAGGDPNISNLLGNNALFFAADRGHEDIVRLLLQRGAKVNVTCMGSTPLHQAIAMKDLIIVKMLVEHGAEVNVLTRDDKKTPLDYAMLVDDPSIALYLKEHGAVSSVALLHKK